MKYITFHLLHPQLQLSDCSELLEWRGGGSLKQFLATVLLGFACLKAGGSEVRASCMLGQGSPAKPQLLCCFSCTFPSLLFLGPSLSYFGILSF